MLTNFSLKTKMSTLMDQNSDNLTLKPKFRPEKTQNSDNLTLKTKCWPYNSITNLFIDNLTGKSMVKSPSLRDNQQGYAPASSGVAEASLFNADVPSLGAAAAADSDSDAAHRANVPLDSPINIHSNKDDGIFIFKSIILSFQRFIIILNIYGFFSCRKCCINLNIGIITIYSNDVDNNSCYIISILFISINKWK